MKRHYPKFAFNIGEAITSFNRELLIIDRKYEQKIAIKKGKEYNLTSKYYKYHCEKCGNEGWIIEYSLKDKQHCGCNVCGRKKVLRGYNDIGTKETWSLQYFVNKDDAFTHSPYSKDVVDFKCPDCGKIHKKPIYIVMANKGLSCHCKDSVSYPNKFMYKLLEQAKVNFECEKKFTWSNKRRYDFVIGKDLSIVVEMQGRQHYDKPIIKKKSRYRTVEEEIENDKLKKEMAIKNGITSYYQIDCSKSTFEYIKDNIIKSGLLEEIGFIPNDMEWSNCDTFALSNIVKNICNYQKEQPDKTFEEIAEIFKVDRATIGRYLKIGNRYGWCDYNKNEHFKNVIIHSKSVANTKPIHCIDNDMYYRSSSIVFENPPCDNVIFFPKQIRQSILRGHKYRGYKFEFVTQENFNEVKTNTPNKAIGQLFDFRN